mgnify:CR=1 FL=1
MVLKQLVHLQCGSKADMLVDRHIRNPRAPTRKPQALEWHTPKKESGGRHRHCQGTVPPPQTILSHP